jgi:hypothetical protein
MFPDSLLLRVSDNRRKLNHGSGASLYQTVAKMCHLECLLLTKSISLVGVKRHHCRDLAS